MNTTTYEMKKAIRTFTQETVEKTERILSETKHYVYTYRKPLTKAFIYGATCGAAQMMGGYMVGKGIVTAGKILKTGKLPVRSILGIAAGIGTMVAAQYTMEATNEYLDDEIWEIAKEKAEIKKSEIDEDDDIGDMDDDTERLKYLQRRFAANLKYGPSSKVTDFQSKVDEFNDAEEKAEDIDEDEAQPQHVTCRKDLDPDCPDNAPAPTFEEEDQ
jgi:hypothetical protein